MHRIVVNVQTGEIETVNMTPEEIAALSTPQPKPVPQSISFAQLLIGLVTEQWITVEEGRAWRDRVALPVKVSALIDALPEEQKFTVETRLLAPSVILRSDPLVSQLGAVEGKTEEEIDDFFRKYFLV